MAGRYSRWDILRCRRLLSSRGQTGVDHRPCTADCHLLWEGCHPRGQGTARSMRAATNAATRRRNGETPGYFYHCHPPLPPLAFPLRPSLFSLDIKVQRWLAAVSEARIAPRRLRLCLSTRHSSSAPVLATRARPSPMPVPISSLGVRPRGGATARRPATSNSLTLPAWSKHMTRCLCLRSPSASTQLFY